MGQAHVLPERIDADTARALVGNDRLYKAILPRAPWAVQKFRAGESISRNEARAIWEREKFDGAPRASEQYVASHELPLRARYDTSTFADREDYERAVAKLERRLFEALSELKAVWKSNLQPDFNVRVCDRFDARLSAVLRELDESNRFVQKSAESTSI